MVPRYANQVQWCNSLPICPLDNNMNYQNDSVTFTNHQLNKYLY